MQYLKELAQEAEEKELVKKLIMDIECDEQDLEKYNICLDKTHQKNHLRPNS